MRFEWRNANIYIFNSSRDYQYLINQKSVVKICFHVGTGFIILLLSPLSYEIGNKLYKPCCFHHDSYISLVRDYASVKLLGVD